MELDPVVLLAYVSVAVNIITIIAAAVAYVIFWIRKHRNRKPEGRDQSANGQFEPVFLRPYQPPTFASGSPVAEPEASGMKDGH